MALCTKLGGVLRQTFKRLFNEQAHSSLPAIYVVARGSATSKLIAGESKKGEQHLPDGNAVKLKICEALECRQEEVALHHLPYLFEFKSVTVSDCNELLKICWSKQNARVAKVLWKRMEERKIELNTFSVACLLSALSRGGCLDEAMELLQMLGSHIVGVQPNIIFCSIFLNGCSYAGSVAHAEQCLRLIKDKGIEEDELVYLELMKLAGKRKDLIAVQKAWAMMVEICKPCMPTLDSYCTAVKALCQAGAYAEALAALREMLQLVSREEVFTLLSQKKMKLKVFSEDREMSGKGVFTESGEATEDVWAQDMVEEDRNPSMNKLSTCNFSDEGIQSLNGNKDNFLQSSHSQVSETLEGENVTGTFSSSFSPASDSHEGERLHTVSMEEESVDARKSPYGQILGWTRLAMLNLQHCELSSSPEILQSVGSTISGFSTSKFDKVKSLLRHAFNAIINAAVNRRDLHSAELLFSQMRAVNLKPDIYTYNAMLRAVVRGRGLHHGFQVVKNMERNGLQPDTVTYTAILEGFCMDLDLDKAEALLQRMQGSESSQRPSNVSFNILIKACADADELIRALRVFSRMVEADVKPDRCTILSLVSAFGRVNFPFGKGTEDSRKELARRLCAIESYMEGAKMQHNYQTFNAVLVALGAEGMAEAVIQRLHLAEGCVDDHGLPILDTISYNTAIHACVQSKQWAAARDLFKRMEFLGFKPDTYTYNIMINGCCERKRIGDAFQLMDTMHKEGRQASLSTYNTLIKVCCHSGELDAAVALLKEMDENGIQPGTVTFTTLLSSAVYQERLDIVEFLVEHMHREKVQPNITICEHVVCAYLSCDQIDDAVEALRVLSIRMLPNDVTVQRQMEHVLKQVYLEDSSQVETSTMQLLKDALVSKGLVSEALLAARLSGFGNAAAESWNAEKSLWAIRLREQYRRIHLL